MEFQATNAYSNFGHIRVAYKIERLSSAVKKEKVV
jgi:hypothetical protein